MSLLMDLCMSVYFHLYCIHPVSVRIWSQKQKICEWLTIRNLLWRILCNRENQWKSLRKAIASVSGVESEWPGRDIKKIRLPKYNRAISNYNRHVSQGAVSLNNAGDLQVKLELFATKLYTDYIEVKEGISSALRRSYGRRCWKLKLEDLGAPVLLQVSRVSQQISSNHTSCGNSWCPTPMSEHRNDCCFTSTLQTSWTFFLWTTSTQREGSSEKLVPTWYSCHSPKPPHTQCFSEKRP